MPTAHAAPPLSKHIHQGTEPPPVWPDWQRKLCSTPPMAEPNPTTTRWMQIASMALFVVLAGYVSISGIRLSLLLWQRFGAG